MNCPVSVVGSRRQRFGGFAPSSCRTRARVHGDDFRRVSRRASASHLGEITDAERRVGRADAYLTVPSVDEIGAASRSQSMPVCPRASRPGTINAGWRLAETAAR